MAFALGFGAVAALHASMRSCFLCRFFISKVRFLSGTHIPELLRAVFRAWPNLALARFQSMDARMDSLLKVRVLEGLSCEVEYEVEAVSGTKLFGFLDLSRPDMGVSFCSRLCA